MICSVLSLPEQDGEEGEDGLWAVSGHTTVSGHSLTLTFSQFQTRAFPWVWYTSGLCEERSSHAILMGKSTFLYLLLPNKWLQNAVPSNTQNYCSQFCWSGICAGLSDGQLDWGWRARDGLTQSVGWAPRLSSMWPLSLFMRSFVLHGFSLWKDCLDFFTLQLDSEGISCVLREAAQSPKV